MATDDDNGVTDASENGPTNTPPSDEDVREAVEGGGDGPVRIEDDPGRADEWFARAIIATPFVLLFVAGVVAGVLVWTGQIGFDVTIDGSISITPLVYGTGGLLALVYLLAAAKEWGVRPVMWVASAARNHRPPENE
jgi:hypothetical protein